MPTTSRASTLSRQTMKRTCSISRSVPRGLDDQRALDVLVEVIEERIFARALDGDDNKRFDTRPKDFFLAQRNAFEFHRLVAGSGQFGLETSGRDFQGGRLERAVRLEGQAEGGQLGRLRGGRDQPRACRGGQAPEVPRRDQYPPFLPVPA